MQAQAGSRKRPAPGTSTRAQQQPVPQAAYPSFPYTEEASNDLNIDYKPSNPSDGDLFFPDATSYDPNFFPTNLNDMQSQPYNASTDPPSNQLVRRNTNQQLAARSAGFPQDQWPSFTNAATGPQDRIWENMDEREHDLDQKAALAKKDAQAKRKQIFPFVQKLWSFLDSSDNTELIRWSDDGDSFVVIDEDEFARTLIPELFKHNNYASFVRQLNMYGFHKKVGLNANSMKAAEKKIKDPNVYWHEYFKRGRADLLWLIQKPQGKTAAAKRKRGNEKKEGGESDDDGRRMSPEASEQQSVSRPGQGRTHQDVAPLPRAEMTQMRDEVQKLRQQQSLISSMITQLRQQNEQFYRQATAFQSLHDRHENSINAILTFLATFYNRSLDGHGGVNLVNMFGNSNASNGNNPQHGSVVDVGDGEYPEVNTEPSQPVPRFKRPQLLLEGPSSRTQSLQPGNVGTPASQSTQSTPSPPNSQPQQPKTKNSLLPQAAASQPPRRASVSPAIKDDADTPNLLNQYPENDDMLSMINAANANTPNSNGPNFDFSSALDHYQTANGNTPLTPQQRDDMLSLMANQGRPSGSANNNAGQGSNNALVPPDPPAMPSLDQLARTQEQLDMLTKLQREQDSKVADLAGRLQPLSPTGAIPGFGSGSNGNEFNGAPGDFDINAFINSDDNYFNNFGGGGGGDGTGNGQYGEGAGEDYDAKGMSQFGADADDDPTGLNWDFGTSGGGGDELYGAGTASADAGNQFENYDSAGAGAEGIAGGGRGGRVESLSSAGTTPASGMGAVTNGGEEAIGTEPSGEGADDDTPSKRRRVA